MAADCRAGREREECHMHLTTTMTTRRQRIGAVLIASAIALGAVPALAQDDTRAGRLDLLNAPVEMHAGTCADIILDPWDAVARLQRQDYPGVPENLQGELVPVSDRVLLTEDLNDDGILDVGEDLNNNDVLDEGIDLDGDAVLDAEEIGVEDVVAIPLLPIIYSAHGTIDAPFAPIFNQPNVIAVHKSSEEYATIVACGNVGGIEFEGQDEVVVGLAPVNDSGVRGYAVFEYDSVLFGDDRTEVTAYLFDRLPTQRETMLEATPVS
jgi:hypothetical protein